MLELRHEHAVVATRDDAKLMSGFTPFLDCFGIALGNPVLAEQGSIVITSGYFHHRSSSFDIDNGFRRSKGSLLGILVVAD